MGESKVSIDFIEVELQNVPSCPHVGVDISNLIIVGSINRCFEGSSEEVVCSNQPLAVGEVSDPAQIERELAAYIDADEASGIRCGIVECTHETVESIGAT